MAQPPMFFGNIQKFKWVPTPSSGAQRRNVFSSESGTLDRGGAFVTRSVGRHAEFDFSFGIREASGATGLNVFQEWATGMWDDYATVVDGYNPNNLLYFCDPFTMRDNQMSPHWAAPMLTLTGDYPHIAPYTSNAATTANSNNQPSRTVTYTPTNTNVMPTSISQRFLIPIPPGFTLRFGWSGAVTGSGTVRVEAHPVVGGSNVATNVSPSAVTSTTRLTNSFNGDTYDYVIIALARTSVTGSTVSVASMMAQTHVNTLTPATTGPHIPGLGQTGCRFDGEAFAEEYIQVDDLGQRRLKGLSFGLIEVGAWLP